MALSDRSDPSGGRIPPEARDIRSPGGRDEVEPRVQPRDASRVERLLPWIRPAHAFAVGSANQVAEQGVGRRRHEEAGVDEDADRR